MTEPMPALAHLCSMPVTPLGALCGEGMTTPIWAVSFTTHDGKSLPKVYRCGAHLVSTVLFLATAQSDADSLILESVTRVSGEMKRERPS